MWIEIQTKLLLASGSGYPRQKYKQTEPPSSNRHAAVRLAPGIKFIDDTSAMRVIPWNFTSLLNTAASDIHNFSVALNMKLNSTKCKEMLINILHNSFC